MFLNVHFSLTYFITPRRQQQYTVASNEETDKLQQHYTNVGRSKSQSYDFGIYNYNASVVIG
jgi:hypothetical protein